jgi:hypothetical protein
VAHEPGRIARSGRARGPILLAPDAVAALAVLVLNDRFLKGRGPGWITGKLSDLAGIYLFPLVLVAVLEVASRALRRPAPPRRTSVAAAALATALVFGAIKVSAPAGDLFQVTFGWLRWPLSATESWVDGDGFSARAHVELVRDPTDLVTLPMAAVAWAVHGRRRDAGDAR